MGELCDEAIALETWATDAEAKNAQLAQEVVELKEQVCLLS